METRLAISPVHEQVDFQGSPTIEQRIDVFCARTLGWQLGIADRLINGKTSRTGRCLRRPVEHSGFAVLHIVFSYFEMIAKYEQGFAKCGASSKYFKDGIRSVFPDFCSRWDDEIECVLDIMYEAGRCGLYHDGIAHKKIIISGCTSQPICAGMSADGRLAAVVINPHRLVPALQDHFEHYVARLRDSQCTLLRRNFTKRWEWLHRGAGHRHLTVLDMP